MSRPDFIGRIYPASSLFLREAGGTAQSDDGIKYELSINPRGEPLIRSEQTGKWFLLSWQEVLDLAIQAGINDPDAAATAVAPAPAPAPKPAPEAANVPPR